MGVRLDAVGAGGRRRRPVRGWPRLDAMNGGIEAEAFGRRLASFTPTTAHVNTLVAASGATVTARTRRLVRNNGYAAAAVESFAVGDGEALAAGRRSGAQGGSPAGVAVLDRRERRGGPDRLPRPEVNSPRLCRIMSI